MEKRYQYRGPNGIEWTKWFKIPDNSVKEKHQDKGLKNEYR